MPPINRQATFSGTTEYMFNHALLRDVTYASLLKRLRRAYHAQVADWLCERSGERVELSHRATDRGIFARGAIEAAHWLCGRAPGAYGLDAMLADRLA